MSYKSFRELEVWQDAMRFVVSLYRATKQFPSDERFGLTNQVQRAAVSIPSNIAEGYAQNSDPTFARFLRIAIGSAAEVETQILIAQQLGYLSNEQSSDLVAQVQSLQRRMGRLLALASPAESRKP